MNAITISTIQQRRNNGSGSIFPIVDLSAVTGLAGFGDSFGEGYGATVPTTGGYLYLIEAAINQILSNFSLGGSGIWYSGKRAAEVLGNNGTSLVIVMAGLNDMRRAGANQKMYNKILYGHRAIGILKWKTSIVAAGSASVTRTGTHSTFNGIDVGGKFGTGNIPIPGNTGSFLNGAGTWSYTFSGTRIGVGMFGCDGVAINWNGDYTIHIDGNLVYTGNNNGAIDGISDGVNNNQRGVLTHVFSGLSSGNHTIVITRVGGIVPVDYFAVLPDPTVTTCRPLIFSEIPYVQDYLKPGANQGSVAISDIASTYIRQVYQEFADLGYPITYVPVNSSPYTSTNDTNDGVHRDDVGYIKMANAFLAQMTGYSANQQFGTLIDETFDSLANWTESGAANFSIIDGELEMSGGSGVFTDYIVNDTLQNTFENFSIEATFKITVAGFGFGIGTRETNVIDTTNRSAVCQFAATGGTSGQGIIKFCNDNTTTFVNRALSTAITWAVGDTIKMTFSRAFNTYTVTVENVTTPQIQTTSYSITGATDPKVGNPGCKFAIYAFGGTVRVTGLIISSTSYKNIRALFVGDSITHYRSASGKTSRYADKVFEGSAYRWEVNAGGGDYTAIYTGQRVHIDSYNADYVFMMLGGNDIFYGIGASTYQANYTTIRNNIVAGGQTVVHLLATPRTGTDVTPLNTWIQATFSGDLIIDTYTPLKGAGTDLSATYDSGDGVHPNDAGHALVATTIRNAIPTLY